MKDIWMTIKYFVIIFVMFFLVNIAADAQSFKCEGNNYTAVSKGRSSEQGEKTPYTYTAKNGKEYQIYIKSDGYCYTIRTSDKTGKEYKSPVKEDISRDICAKMKREYTHKTNKRSK